MTPTQRKKLVVAHSTREGAPLHEVETNRALARWLAHTVLRGRLPLPGLLNPDWLAARFTRVHYDATKAQRQLEWQPVHNALADLAQRPPH